MADFRVQGWQEIVDRMRQLAPKVARTTLGRSVSSGAVLIQREIQQRAPVDTGRMRAAVYRKRIRDPSDPLHMTYIIGVRSGPRRNRDGTKDYSRDAWYWVFKEFGTSKMPAEPFVRPGFEATGDAAVRQLLDSLWRGIQLHGSGK
ncbi:hypothetical protein PPN31114_03515 [Pandoraea pneumonica]|uniref:HK97 gp10 family phage protein n=1 Tax=Pandoraea pneumonica TaxID=2508299 RepID=A0A5E4WTS0_9BURK|nr:HK97-gp10 family putative phage morphogenesis protein [Pandoraea pneumonica]VVE28238.1 hypothetical protein PPN31114_03515 [Pandoraea pneumonica]